jgi:Transposase DDE domain group 1
MVPLGLGAGEVFPRVGFIVTTLTGTNRAVVHFYNGRGTAEQWIKEGTEAAHWTRLSCHRFLANEVRLPLGIIAYNLGNLQRRLVLPLAIQSWSLTSLQQRLFKTGERLIRHARYFVPQLAESYLTGSPFWADPLAYRATRVASDLIEKPPVISSAPDGTAGWRGCNALCNVGGVKNGSISDIPIKLTLPGRRQYCEAPAATPAYSEPCEGPP